MKRKLAAFLVALALVTGIQVAAPAPAEAHAACDGADHRDWHWQFPWGHWDYWQHVRAEARYWDGYWHVRYLYFNETHGYYQWSGWCN